MPPSAQEPPRAILTDPAACSEQDGAAALFVDALKPASAPESGWTVRVHVVRTKGKLRAESALSDAAGVVRAQRDFTVNGASCAPLARAVGVWASLVLDGFRPIDGTDAPVTASDDVDPNAGATPAPPPEPRAGLAPPPFAPTERIRFEEEEPSRFSDEPAIEIGLSTFLMNAGNTGPLVGGSAFVMVELPARIFLRPRASFGKNFGPLQAANDVDKDLGTLRVDGCLRVSGFYWDRRGLAVDVCGGAEGGFLTMGARPETGGASRTLAYGAFGPGIGLRGEFANDFVAEVRAEGLMRVAEGLPIGGRAEMAVTWRAR